MKVYEIILLILGIGLNDVLCFLIGAKTGQKVVKDEPIELPKINPVQVIRDMEQKREQDKANEEYKYNLEQINNYDGNV